MEPIVSLVAVVLLVTGLVGNGFEMRRIRLSIVKDEDLNSRNIFLNKKNWKWYVIIGIALVLWVLSQNTPNGTI